MTLLLKLANSLVYPGLAAKIAPYKVTRDEDMPAVLELKEAR